MFNWFNFIIGLICLSVCIWMCFWKYKQKFWWSFYFVIELICAIGNMVIVIFGKIPDFGTLFL